MRVSMVREGSAPPGPRSVTWDNPSDVAEALRAIVPDDGTEHFGAVFLSVRHRPIGVALLSHGCLTAALVHAREVFAPAIVSKAAGVVVFHSHPSGDPEPSAEDMSLTRRLASAGQLLGIELLDHIVLGMGPGAGFVSLKERGIL